MSLKNTSNKRPHPRHYRQVDRILRKQKIRISYRPHKIVGSLLRSPKNKIPLKRIGIHDCSHSQSNRCISRRVKEHTLAVDIDLKTSALAQHTIETGHNINFDATKLLAAMKLLQKRIIRELIEI